MWRAEGSRRGRVRDDHAIVLQDDLHLGRLVDDHAEGLIRVLGLGDGLLQFDASGVQAPDQRLDDRSKILELGRQDRVVERQLFGVDQPLGGRVRPPTHLADHAADRAAHDPGEPQPQPQPDQQRSRPGEHRRVGGDGGDARAPGVAVAEFDGPDGTASGRGQVGDHHHDGARESVGDRRAASRKGNELQAGGKVPRFVEADQHGAHHRVVAGQPGRVHEARGDQVADASRAVGRDDGRSVDGGDAPRQPHQPGGLPRTQRRRQTAQRRHVVGRAAREEHAARRIDADQGGRL